MKKLFALASLGLLAMVVLAQSAGTRPVTLSWNPSPPEQGILVYKVYKATTLVGGTTNMAGGITNFQTTTFSLLATVSPPQTSLLMSMVPGQAFFYVTASNAFWGESDPSYAVQTPAGPSVSGLKIQ